MDSDASGACVAGVNSKRRRGGAHWGGIFAHLFFICRDSFMGSSMGRVYESVFGDRGLIEEEK